MNYQSKVIKEYKECGYIVLNLIRLSENGYPDLLCLKDGKAIFIECKTGGDTLKPLQKYRIDELIKEGLIQRFEYTHELAWNVMKDYALFQGNSTIGGSRDATREAYKLQIIENADLWMDMIISRNQTSHNYNQEVSNEIFEKISNQYLPLFVGLKLVFEKLSTSTS